MRQTFTLSMSWLHTWAGLFFGWLLFAIWTAGTLCIFWYEIETWARPQMHGVTPAPAARQIDFAVDHLSKAAPHARIWNIALSNPDGRDLMLKTGRDVNFFTYEYFTADASGRRITLPTNGGRFFVDFHWTLNIYQYVSKIPFMLVGLAGIAFMVIIITGVVVHKRIFKDFFTFRRKASDQRSWLDAHNMLGVLPLPFHFLIALTGVSFFCFQYVPSAVAVLYNGNEAAMSTEMNDLGPMDVVGTLPGKPAPLFPVSQLLTRAEAEYGKGLTGAIKIRDPGRDTSVIEFARGRDGSITTIYVPRVRFNGVTGERIGTPGPQKAAFAIWDKLSSLHFAFFGGNVLRLFYLLCGVAGMATIATGLLLYTIKRAEKPETIEGGSFLWFADRMNVGAIAGPMVASIVYMWAVRLLPFDMAERRGAEVIAFFAAWVASLGYAFLRSPRRSWRDLLALTEVLCLGLPLLGFLVPDSSLPFTIGKGDWATAGVDLAALAFGLCFVAAWQIVRRPRIHTPRRRSAVAATTELIPESA